MVERKATVSPHGPEDDDDLDAILSTMPDATQKAFKEMRALQQATDRALRRMLLTRRSLLWLLPANLVLALVNAVLLWERVG